MRVSPLVLFSALAVGGCGQSPTAPQNAVEANFIAENTIAAVATPVPPTPNPKPLGENASDTTANAPDAKSKESEFRSGVQVDFFYNQELGAPYSTAWYGRLEKTDGPWRDVYLETNEKYTTSGVLSFRCDQPEDSPLGWVGYDLGEGFGDPSKQKVTKIRTSDFRAWRADSLEFASAYNPPYELYIIVRSKFC